MDRDSSVERHVETTTAAALGAGRESLAQIAKRLRGRTRAGSQAEYEVAREIVQLSDSWDDARSEEAGGKSFAEWLTKEVSPTKRLAHYKTLDSARAVLGALAERMTSEAATWLYRAASKEKPDAETRERLNRAFRGQSSALLTRAQVRRLCGDLVSRGASGARVDAVTALRQRVERLEEQIRGLGAEPVE